MSKKKITTKQSDLSGRRSANVIRLIKMIIHLSRTQSTTSELMRKYNVCRRTVMRDIRAIDAIGIPVYTETHYWNDDALSEHEVESNCSAYRIDPHWIKRFI